MKFCLWFLKLTCCRPRNVLASVCSHKNCSRRNCSAKLLARESPHGSCAAAVRCTQKQSRRSAHRSCWRSRCCFLTLWKAVLFGLQLLLTQRDFVPIGVGACWRHLLRAAALNTKKITMARLNPKGVPSFTFELVDLKTRPKFVGGMFEMVTPFWNGPRLARGWHLDGAPFFLNPRLSSSPKKSQIRSTHATQIQPLNLSLNPGFAL